jgi:hypothetical protein
MVDSHVPHQKKCHKLGYPCSNPQFLGWLNPSSFSAHTGHLRTNPIKPHICICIYIYIIP